MVAPELQRGGPPTRGWLAVAPALLLAVASAACGEAAFDARVASVKDGDSFEAVRVAHGREERVGIRIFGIDAPERGQPWSKRAREALSGRVLGKTVHVAPVDVDRYGRTVGEVTADGACVGCEQVRAGLAWVYRRYTKSAALLALEDEARAAGRGLWSAPVRDRIPPWEWRRDHRDKLAP